MHKNVEKKIFLFKNRTKSLVNEINMGVTGVSGVAFGGPKRDTLFVTATGAILNLFTGKPTQMITSGSSLYKVTCLGVTGTKSTSLKIPAQKCV